MSIVRRQTLAPGDFPGIGYRDDGGALLIDLNQRTISALLTRLRTNNESFRIEKTALFIMNQLRSLEHDGGESLIDQIEAERMQRVKG